MTQIVQTGPGRISQFIWGTSQQGTLSFVYPAALDGARFWRMPLPGSEIGQVNDQQDSWIIGRDFMAALEVRWLLPSAVTDFQRFLDWAHGGGSFGFIPDAVNAPLYVVPGCLLVEPFDQSEPETEDNGLQKWSIVFRNSTYDLGLSWR